MKKKRNHFIFSFIGKIEKKSKNIRCAFFLNLLFVICSFGNVQSQQKITIQLGETTIKSALSEFERQTNKIVVYGNENLKTDKVIKVNLKKVTEVEFLEFILKGTEMTYYSRGDYIVIIPKDVKVPDTKNDDKVTMLRGKVTEPDGTPLVGVTIKIKDTSIGTVTDVNGDYFLVFPRKDKEILIITYVGKKTKEHVFYHDDEIVNIVLEDEIEVLDDVVITGYSNIREVSFTGSSKRFTKDELKNVSQNNLLKALEALDPSFITIQNNEMGSNPNNLPEYYIRGRSGTPLVKDLDIANSEDISEFSLTNNPSEPIFILDGFEVTKTKIFDLDINRVSSVTVLKDAAATAFYGSRAANGVIVIETIAPLPGEVLVNYNGNLEVTIPDISSYNLLNPEEMLRVEWLAGYYNDYVYGYGINNYDTKMNIARRGIETHWISKPLRTEVNHSHSLYLTGGMQELRWGVGLSYRKNGGIMKESGRDTYGVDVTLDYRKNNFQLKNKFTMNSMSSKDSPYGNFSDYVQMKPYLQPYGENGELSKLLEIAYTKGPENTSSGAITTNNPLYEASLESFNKTKYTEYTDNLEFLWFPDNYLTAKGQFSLTSSTEEREKFTDPASGNYENLNFSQKGELSTNHIKNNSWELRGSLSYMRYFNRHNININWVIEAKETKRKSLLTYYQGFPSGEYSSVSWANNVKDKPTYQDNNQRTFGTFLSLNYSWNDVYLFDFSYRIDGNSAFGAKKKIGNFWALGMGINIHKYSFMNNVTWLNNLKISTTYGLTGKANFSPYQSRTTYDMLFDGDYATVIGMKLKAMGNEQLKWERNRQYNARLQISTLQSRINLDFEYYRNRTLDMVESMNIRSSSGFRTYTSNVGEVVNEGVNFTLEIIPIRTSDWTVSLGWNGIHNTNKLTKIGDALKEYNDRIDEYYTSSSNDRSKPFTKYQEGNSLSAIYGMKSLGIDPSTGDEVFLNRDGSIASSWTSSEQQKLGDTEPKLNGTVRINIRWKNLSLYNIFTYNIGGQQYNQTLANIENLNLREYSGDKRILYDRWQKPGDEVKLRGLSNTSVTRPTSRFVQDDKTIRFTSLTLDYRLPHILVKKAGISSANLKFTMNDIVVISSIKQERGTIYPYSHTFNLGLNLNF